MKNPKIWRRETSQSFNQNAAIGDFRDQPEREPDADRPPKLHKQNSLKSCIKTTAT